jgi:hypothetical protein
MTAERTIVEILDETTQALITLDLPKLLELEERAKLWASSVSSFDARATPSFQRKQHQLSLILQATSLNLNLLRRVRDKGTESQWAL